MATAKTKDPIAALEKEIQQLQTKLEKARERELTKLERAQNSAKQKATKLREKLRQDQQKLKDLKAKAKKNATAALTRQIERAEANIESLRQQEAEAKTLAQTQRQSISDIKAAQRHSKKRQKVAADAMKAYDKAHPL